MVGFGDSEYLDIKRRAIEASKVVANGFWIRAYQRLADAANCLRLMQGCTQEDEGESTN